MYMNKKCSGKNMHTQAHTHTHTHSCILNVRVVSQGMQNNNKMADVLHTKETETYMYSNIRTCRSGTVQNPWSTNSPRSTQSSMLTEHVRLS